MVRWCVALASIVVLAACGDDGGGSGAGGENAGGTGGGGGTGGTGGVGGTAEPVSWEPCLLPYFGEAECATLAMPLDRDDPASPELDFFVRRIPAVGESRGQLWMLQGGPGYNGAFLAYYSRAFAEGLGLDVYMPDYRGVGRSSHLGCEEDISNRVCMADLRHTYGEDLVRFSTSDAVRDVGEAIERLRKPGEEVYVWGTSYGTVTAHRFLHLFPDLANGVILDSACGAAGCDFTTAEVDYDRNAHDIADLCAGDAFCREKMGDDPWTKVADVLDRVEAGHCPEAFASASRYYVRPIFTSMMGPTFAPAVGLAMIARLDRCEPADAQAVAHLLQIFLGGGAGWVIEDAEVQSQLLYYNIVFNEFWDETVTYEELEAMTSGLVATTGAVLDMATRYEGWTWPRYEVPAELRVWADADVPVLILNGTLDAQTRHENMADAADAFTRPDQHVVIVPYATHGVFMGSAPTSADPSVTCGAAITRQFLSAPTGPLDLVCLGEQVPPRFDRTEHQSYWFGTPDLWENVAAAAPALAEIDDPAFLWRLEQGRARLRHLRR